MKFVEEKNNDIMSFNNQLANLQVNFKWHPIDICVEDISGFIKLPLLLIFSLIVFVQCYVAMAACARS